MPEVDDLIAEADRRLESHDFAAARDAYREAALAAVPGSKLMANLEVAEEEDRLQFRRRLANRHTGAYELRAAEAHLLQALHRPRQALEIYSAILENRQFPAEAAVPLRLSRWRAAVAAADYETAAEDFCFLWEVSQFRSRLARDLARLDREESAQLLETLAERIPALKLFVNSKLAELRALADLLGK